jgi:hypothetical protein
MRTRHDLLKIRCTLATLSFRRAFRLAWLMNGYDYERLGMTTFETIRMYMV